VHRARNILLALLVAGAALAAVATAAQAPPSPSLIGEGPGGRTPLTHWTMRRDPADRGLGLGWQRGSFPGAGVSVPSVVSAAWLGAAGKANYEGSVAWYRTTFTAPGAGVYALTFQSANFRANVWVDGRALGSHRGSYLPFEERARLGAGRHTVVVRIDWRDPAMQSKLGFHRTWFNWGGLDGDVEVREIGESELANPTIATTVPQGASSAGSSPSASVKLGVEVRNDAAAGRPLIVEGSLTRGGQSIPLRFPEVRLAHGGSTVVSTTVSVPEAALWSPTSPSLYELKLAIGGECSYTAHVGLRQITWHGGEVYLNGKHLLLHGATIQEDAEGHGDALTPRQDAAIVSELQSIGANAVRAQHPLNPALLERLDAAGIMVWQGIGPVEGAGNWYSNSRPLLADAERDARTAATAEQLHPSVFAWNLVDEVANNGRDRAEVQYVQSLAHWLHAHDPTRLVAVDVWGDHPPRQPGAIYRGIDAVAETDYSGWYDNPGNPPSAVSAEISRRLQAMQRTFAGKVLVISEFGAESNTLNPPGAPGSYSFQARLLARHIRIYAADPKLTAMFIWLLRDYPLTPEFEGGSIHAKLPDLKLIEGLNQKGLFTYGGHPKPAVSTVGALYRSLPG
jgi:beta-glucuronidase